MREEDSMIEYNNSSKHSATTRSPTPEIIDIQSVELGVEEEYIDNNNSLANRNPETFDMNVLPILQLPLFNRPKLNDFGSLSHLRYGPCSHIYRGRFGDLPVIVKTMRRSAAMSILANREFKLELESLSHLSHPHIISLYGGGRAKLRDTVDMMTVPFLVLEDLTGDTLAHHLSAKKSSYGVPFSKARYLRMARELADALQYIHYSFNPDCVLIHRDLKPDNIGFTKDGTLKLFDFGLCTSLRRGASDRAVYQLSGCTGTFRYMAPETALTQPYNEKVDVYGFAMVMYEVATGCTPFPHYTKERFYREVVRGGARPSLDIDTHGNRIKMPLDLKTLIAQCWDTDYVSRPSSTEVYALIQGIERKVALKAETQRGRFSLRAAVKGLFSTRDPI